MVVSLSGISDLELENVNQVSVHNTVPEGLAYVECDDPVNTGLPKLDLGDKPTSFFEFWPAWFFYLPVVVYWVYLSLKYRNFGLPMVVNPNIELGGMVGESKIGIMNSISDPSSDYWLPFISDTKLDDLDGDGLEEYVDLLIKACSAKGMTFPLVIKPDLGCRGAGVSLLKNKEHMIEYVRRFPVGRSFMIQVLAPYTAEAGVFYQREPGAQNGVITSITLKYMPYVKGDGVSTLRDLILSDARAKKLKKLYMAKNKDRLDVVPKTGEYVTLAFAGSHCRGSVFRDGNRYITEELTQAINEIAQSMPDFHYGRFDIKFKNLNQLRYGKDFSLIEINGASSEATHIWDSRGTLRGVFATLLGQYKTLFRMGQALVDKGYKTPSAATMVRIWLRELENTKTYPDSATEL